MKKKHKKPIALRVRRFWQINPDQKPHSSKKGKKGFNKKRERQKKIDH